MDDKPYRIAGWIERKSPQWLFRAEFGPYATLEAAQRAAQIMVGPGRVITITCNSSALVTYQDGVPVDNFDEVAFLLAHMDTSRAAE